MGFFRRWAEGIRNLSPEDLLSSKRVGYIGQLCGMTLAGTVLVLRGYWYWSLFFLFALVVFVIEIIGVSQQLAQIRRFRPGVK